MDHHEVNSLTRIVEIYEKLRQNGSIRVEQLALHYGKHPETIKKDIRYMKEALGSSGPAIDYDPATKLYKMEQARHSYPSHAA